MQPRRFFSRKLRSKVDLEHVGRSGNIQTFYEAPTNDKDKDAPKWVDYAPPSLPQAKREKHEGAAIQIYKCRRESVGGDGFRIEKVRLQSPYLRKALHTTLEKYGIKYDSQEIYAESIRPHYGLFFALDQVAELAKTADDEVTRSHCGLLCSIIEEIFGDTLDKLEKLEEEGKITFDLLWTLFPPQSIFATLPDGQPPIAYRVKQIWQNKDQLKIKHETVVFDGFRYGTYSLNSSVYSFEGAVPVVAIPDCPFIDINRDTAMRARLIERGKKALEMQSIRYMVDKPPIKANDESASPWLKGQNHQRVIIDPYLYRLRRVKWFVKPLPGYNLQDEELDEELDEVDGEVGAKISKDTAGEGKQLKHSNAETNGPMRVDGRGRSQGVNGNSFFPTEVRRPTKSEMDRNRRVVLESEDNLLILYHKVAGYSIDKRTWELFYIENLHPFQGDRTVFDKVVLDQAKKDIVMTLIEGHKELTARYDDLIEGKGQYLLVILSGPPGTGKTLMAESLAEHLGCPLLRADPTSIQPNEWQTIYGYDATLTQFLKDATEWGGLVLFDEPDFLFQSQSGTSDDRKDLLAFLRQAEYFKGVIFLTTNLSRGSIDPAVLSRAQIHIPFPSLNATSRARVWKGFVDRLPDDVGTLDDDAISRLSEWLVNGREIKNILNMSVSWCRRKGCKLSVEYVETLITTICPSAAREEGVESKQNGEVARRSKGDLLLLDM